jgi:tetratricopeptide (TPR) repeat protein
MQPSLSALRRPSANPGTRKEALVLTAQVRQRLGDAEAARATLDEAAAAPPPAPWPDPVYEGVLNLRAGKQAQLDRADRLLADQRVAEAVALLRQTVKDYPESDWAWLLLGRALLTGGGDAAGAETAFRESARLAPDAAGPQYHLGIVLLMRKQYAPAAARLRRAADLQPDFAPAHFNLGRCLLIQGDRAAAVGAFEAALRHQPGYADAHELLGEALAGQGKTAEAVKHLRQAVELNPASATAKSRLRRVQKRAASR